MDRHARDELVAYYIYNFRERQHWSRNSDPLDDLCKAHYLNDLAHYFAVNHAKVIPMIDGHTDLDDSIKLVFKIFDRAFFNWERHRQSSDLDCFVEAERYYCTEKALEYLAYLNYEKRTKQGLIGDQKTDYYAAVRDYPDWKRQIEEESRAMSCAS